MGFYQTWRNDLALHRPRRRLDRVSQHVSDGTHAKTRRFSFLTIPPAPHRAIAPELLDGFADRYFPAYTALPFQTFPVDQLKDIAGNYQSTRRADSTKLAISNPAGQGCRQRRQRRRADDRRLPKICAATRANGNPSARISGKSKTIKRRLFAIRDSSGKIVRLAVSFPGVQFQRVPWYEHKTFVGISVAVSLLILLSVVTSQPHPLGPKSCSSAIVRR